MNRPAIDDLLSNVISTWCESVAEWVAPGALSGATCSSCRDTALAAVLNVADWPHDLIHQFATEVESSIAIVAESLRTETDLHVIGEIEEYRQTCTKDVPDCVRDYVTRVLTSRSADLLDVLHECVSDRIDAWVESQADSLTPHLRG